MWVSAAAAAKSLQSCLTLCDPIDGSPPGSTVPGILQARTLEWVAISFSNAWKWTVKVKLLQSCPTLSDPMDCSPPCSSVHGIFQARVLEWGAIAFSGGCLHLCIYLDLIFLYNSFLACFLNYLIILFLKFLIAIGLCCCTQAFSSYSERGLLSSHDASLVVRSIGSWRMGFSSCCHGF